MKSPSPFPTLRPFGPALLLVLLTALSGLAPANAASKKSSHAGSGDFSWDNAIIQIEVTGKEYNYVQPWTRSERKVYKSGVLIEGQQIITTADGLADQTLIRLRKHGTGLFSLGTVVWIDYQANLAAITTDEKDFWTGLQPARLADPTPISGDVRVQRWEDDNLDNHEGEIERLYVDNSALSFVSVPVLKIDSTIPSAGYSEAITVGDKLVGLTTQADGESVMAVPSSFIASILKARAAKAYTGLGYFDFTWDPIQNPLCLDYLKLPGSPRGVIVKDTGLKPGLSSLVKPRDVILQIDGFDIDTDGNYQDPDYKKLSLENLSSRGKWASSDCKFKIWRDGKEMDITYKLPKAEFTDDLVPNQSFDQDPEYVLTGGFVFVPLTNAYLRSWGPSWRQSSPFRLFYYNMDKVTADHPQRVVLSQVLPDEVNIGYEGLRNTVVDEINGMKIRQISDVITALKSPVNGYDVFKFVPGQPLQQAVLDASMLDEANQEIMARFHIPTDHVINGEIAQGASTTPTTHVVQK